MGGFFFFFASYGQIVLSQEFIQPDRTSGCLSGLGLYSGRPQPANTRLHSVCIVFLVHKALSGGP